jgi:hypothetical protein
MENEEKNPYLFYFIIALIVLGFIASLALPLNAQEHKLRDASDAETSLLRTSGITLLGRCLDSHVCIARVELSAVKDCLMSLRSSDLRNQP